MTENLDQKLIQQYLAGDEESLESLIQKYLRPIYRLVYGYLKNASEADDLTQEVFIRMWRHLKKFDQRRPFKPWLFTIAKNACLDFLRKKKTVPFSQFEDQNGENALLNNLADLSPLPDEVMDKLDYQQKLILATDQLPIEQRDILRLYHHEDLNFREIAAQIHKSINTVKSRYRRALMALRKIILPSEK